MAQGPCIENTGLYIPLQLLLPKDKAFAFPSQTKTTHMPHDSSDFLAEVMLANAHKRAGASKLVTLRVLWH